MTPEDLKHILSSKKGPIYGNCSVQDPLGNEMFKCLPKRAQWYLDRNLAYIVQEDPLIVQLTFQPKGKGNIGDVFSLSLKDNRCVCCGATDFLTRHHIVPRCYKKVLPIELKGRDAHDVVPLCTKHHWEYERHADELKKELSEKYGAPFQGRMEIAELAIKALKAARALLKPHDRIPAHLQVKMHMHIEAFLGVNHLTEDDIRSVSKLVPKKVFNNDYTHGAEVMKHIINYHEFFKMWRKHFLEYAKPKYMPKHWDINRPVQPRRS